MMLSFKLSFMLCIYLETHDPFFNLALEEVLLKSRKEEYLILGINTPSLIIGKHQVAQREADTRFVTENSIPVIRRISGGGTVFHDSGNLNFTFIRQSEPGRQVDFRKHTQPVIDYLISLGINAEFEGKNDIKVDRLKISGNAEHVHRNRVLHHGTLLYSSSLDLLRKSIRTDKSCYTTRAVESNPSSVMNLKDKTNLFAGIDEFSKGMMQYFSCVLADFESYNISLQDIEEAETLAESKYKTWEWNYAYGPEYTFCNTFRSGERTCSCTLSIAEGKVIHSTITGSEEFKSLAEKLKGCRHTVADFLHVLEKENIGLTGEEVFNFF
jgi:lipoate-protein ligase A